MLRARVRGDDNETEDGRDDRAHVEEDAETGKLKRPDKKDQGVSQQ
jgi:hypothetical protein